MGKKYKPVKPSAVQAATNNDPHPLLDFVNKDVTQRIITALLMLAVGAFYWSQQLFQASDLNDFSEYYLRALDWSRGKFTISGGSDLLLSAVEYLGIVISSLGFLESYYAASKILIFLVIGSAF